jgi:6-phosphogluconolactonase/glucosamine-6-phosphate isomerase/deaminase
MKIEIFADADAVAREAAAIIAAEARAAVAERGRFIMAVSGGHTPWVMLRDLAGDEVPWDNVHLAQVAVTGIYQGRRRITLTYPILNRARRILWLITGSEKAGMFVRLRKADRSIPAGRVNQESALVLADRAAAGQKD